MQISDDIFLGAAFAPGPSPFAAGNPAPMERGVGPMGRILVYDIVPLTLATAGIAALQTTAGAASLVLTASGGATSRLRPDGTTEIVLDVERSVTLTSAGNLSALTFTVVGTDMYGNVLRQSLSGPNANTVATSKTFRTVAQVLVSGAVGTNVSVGFGDRFGLPVRVNDIGYVQSVKWAGVLAQDAGTVTVADGTTPATAATGNVRGHYVPSSAANGARRLVMSIAVPATACGPQATTVGAYGVTQF